MFKLLLYFGGILPFVLLIILNFSIIYKATRYSRRKMAKNLSEIKREKKRNEMIKTIIILTFMYVAIQLPCAIFNGYFYAYVIKLDVGTTIVALFNIVQFTYPAFNIFILFFSNKIFAREVKKLIGFVKMSPIYDGETTLIA